MSVGKRSWQRVGMLKGNSYLIYDGPYLPSNMSEPIKILLGGVAKEWTTNTASQICLAITMAREWNND